MERVADTGWRESSKGIVAGGWATISGRRLGAGSVAGVAVEIGGRVAVLQAARTSPAGDELDLIVPRLASGTAPLVVTTAEGVSAPFSVSVREFQPSLFSVEAGDERHADALTLDCLERIGPFELSGRQEGEPGSRPAAPLEKISLFVNGCGLWTDVPEPGIVAREALAFPAGASVSIGGEAAEVLFAGTAVGRASQCRLDLKVPSLPAGTHEVVLELGGAKAQAGVWMVVKEAPYPGFEHGKQSSFRLSGSHVFVECTQCHVRSRFWGTPTACEACHLDRYTRTITPNHEEAGFPADCAQCHRTSLFTVTRFGHGKGRFALTGKHQRLACGACHTTGVTDKPDAACAACHLPDYEKTTNPPHPAAGMGKDCGVCHSPDGWLGAKVDHARSGFPLTGKHAATQCVSCHKEGAAQKPEPACVNCHLAQYQGAANPNHASAGYPTGCDACHTPAAWKPAKVDHPRQRFPLTGKHAALQCNQCHQDGQLGALAPACVSCHLNAYEQTSKPGHVAAGFPKTCEGCHSSAGWGGATLPHTLFPLTGRHLQASCASCHVGGKFAGTPKSCAGCHLPQFDATTNPDHKGQGYPTDCQLCHSSSQFKGARFLHASFALAGKHTAVGCAGCHVAGKYQGTARDCVGCHLPKFNATTAPSHPSAGFPTTCQTCHTTAGWKPAQFAHTFQIYSGKHSGKWSKCSDCHTNAANFKVFSCAQCHSKSKIDGEHKSVKGYAYDFPTCLNCHPTGRKP